MKHFRKLFSITAILLVFALLLGACTKPAPVETPVDAPVEEPVEAIVDGIDCTGVKEGDVVSMLYQWSGEEEAKLTEILTPWLEACKASVSPKFPRPGPARHPRASWHTARCRFLAGSPTDSIQRQARPHGHPWR